MGKVRKPTLVLMAGLPGAGKTTLAYALRRRLRWYLIDKDMLKDELSEAGLEDEKAGATAYNLSFAIARNVLGTQRASVILDSAALHRFILDNAVDIVRSTDARLKVILCVADRDLRNRRLRERPTGTPLTVDPATIADYFQCFKHLPWDNTLILYTEHPLTECVVEAGSYLTK
jgi:predicted kinase